jgi:hypothetical protein
MDGEVDGMYANAWKWDACLNIATTLTTMTPERRFGWIHSAQSRTNPDLVAVRCK